ncbi:hypothetical protein [Uliginosibacterium sp. H1]|uniref:hypothetical protein n=1 Tax=Uliginosibacterium sp. H1 TaxID=3114757 RepID=UPI002E185817|nr:hypothetical protein [Uliginosibacterium sp. H1]
MSVTSTRNDVVGDVIDWLTSQPTPDLDAESRALAAKLAALATPGVTSAQFHRCIELFYSRALQLSGEVRRELRTEKLPLETDRLQSVRLLADSLFRVAVGFVRVLSDARQGAIRSQRRLNETASARALRILTEHFLVINLAGTEPAPEMWATAYQLYLLSRMEADPSLPPGSPAETALFAYKRLLALPTVAPRSLSPAELDWAAEYLTRISGQAHVQAEKPQSLEGGWYWIDPDEGAEPQACSRREPPSRNGLLFFSTQPLARRAAEALARHEGGRGGPELEPSELYPGVQPVSLLQRLRQRWSAPAKREQPRRRQEYEVDVCVGLQAIWEVLRGRRDPAEVMSHWKVQNESPGGIAILHVSGLTGGIMAGSVLCLRASPGEAWSLCLVRWMRTDKPGHVELGLQIVSKGAIPVQVGFRGNDRQNPMVDALVLPVLPALRKHQAVLAPSGTYTSRRFLLISDVDRLYVAQGRLLSLDMQTSSVELFQFEIDPYPI